MISLGTTGVAGKVVIRVEDTVSIHITGRIHGMTRVLDLLEASRWKKKHNQ
jgi:hypothetical protein